MTARTSIARLADCAPVASPESWAGQEPPRINLEHRSAQLEAIWRRNMARRDEDADKHGEPRNPNEFYRGRKT
jgi:hypothetical protein